MAYLDQLNTNFKDAGLQVLAVNANKPNVLKLVRPYIEKRKYKFPVSVDPSAKLAKKLGVLGYPTLFIVGKDGTILHKSNGYTEEEIKFNNESRKILNDKNILLSATTVRVPVIRSHSISLNIEFKGKIEINKIKKEIIKFPGIDLIDNPKKNQFPTPIDSSNKDNCIIGRIRKDYSKNNSIWAWIVGDQIRKGAALNAIQIAELLVRK